MIRATVAFLLLAVPAAAQDYPRPLSPYVSDFADVLDAATEARVTEALRTAREDPGTEIAVVTIRSRQDYGPSDSIESFATGLFNDWGIGERERNHGILILVAVDDREMRLELGGAYPPAWDTVAENVIDNTFLPRFRNGEYPEGIERGVDATVDRIARPFARNLPPPDPPRFGWLREWWPALAFGTALAAFFSLFGVLIWSSEHPKCPNCGRRTTSRNRVTLTKATRTVPGEAEETILCRSCDYHGTRTVSLPVRSSSSSSSGSSGFGGGSSSGGGASGRW